MAAAHLSGVCVSVLRLVVVEVVVAVVVGEIQTIPGMFDIALEKQWGEKLCPTHRNGRCPSGGSTDCCCCCYTPRFPYRVHPRTTVHTVVVLQPAPAICYNHPSGQF